MGTERRGSRDAGKATRRILLAAATEIFIEHGEQSSIAQISARAGTYPNQVTYYFGSKEQLFVEVACAAVLRAGQHAEESAAAAATVRGYARTLVAALLEDRVREVELFTTAMLVAGRRTDLRDQITDTLRTLHERGAAALGATLARTGWQLEASAPMQSKAFWSAIFGLVVQKSATGPDFAYSLEEAVSVTFASMKLPDRLLDHPLALPPTPQGAR